MHDWRMVRLGDLAADEQSAVSKPYGSAIFKNDYRPAGIPVVRGVNLARGIFHDDGFVFISPDLADKMPGAQLRSGDLVVTHRGTVGQVSMIPRVPRYQHYVASTSHVKVRLDPERAVPEFFYYWFCSPRGRRTLLENTSTVGVPGLVQPVATVKRLSVPCPPVPEQRAIAEVLGALDDKIAANTKLESNLSAYVSAAFDQIVGKGSARIPLGKLVTTAKGVSYKSVDLAQSGAALVTLKSFVRSGGYSEVGLKPYVGPYRETQRIWPGELAVAQTDLTQGAEIIGRVVRIPPSHKFNTLVASLDVVIVRPVTPVPTEFILGVMLERAFREHCRTRTSGTTVLHLAADAIGAYDAPNVPNHVQSKYASVVGPVLDLGESVSDESRRLAAIRDALLSQLMSGRLRVKDAEAVAESVL